MDTPRTGVKWISDHSVGEIAAQSDEFARPGRVGATKRGQHAGTDLDRRCLEPSEGFAYLAPEPIIPSRVRPVCPWWRIEAPSLNAVTTTIVAVVCRAAQITSNPHSQGICRSKCQIWRGLLNHTQPQIPASSASATISISLPAASSSRNTLLAMGSSSTINVRNTLLTTELSSRSVGHPSRFL